MYANDFVILFNKILYSKTHIGYIFKKTFKEIKLIDKYNFYLITTFSNPSAHKILSIYNTGCLDIFNSFGPYYIKEYSNNKILLCRNKFYRQEIYNKSAKEICFKLNSNLNELNLFNDKKIDITNHTKSDFKSKNLIKENSNIYINLSFSPELLEDKYIYLRKYIMNSIDREKINNIFVNPFICLYDFINYKKSVKKIKSKYKFPKNELTLGYNDFYPNGIIANQIKEQLSKYGIKITLVKNTFNIKSENDLNLILNYQDYDSIESIFDSPYYNIVLNNLKYNFLLRRYKKTNNYKYIKLLNNLLIKKVIKIPLFKLNSYYLKNDKLKQFNYEELNYKEL